MKKVFLQLLNKPVISLMIRYGIVGVVAALVHGSISYLVVNNFDLYYLYAHSIGFLFGLFVAYTGHYHFSFKDGEKHGKRFPKFLVIASIAFTAHEGGAYILVDYNGLDYSTQVLPVLILVVPIFTFLLNKFWVFSKPPETQ